MSAARILHFLSPAANVSPFDVNMAIDAGYQHVVPYTGVSASDVTALVQDAIFSRPPGRFRETAVFLGGWDVNLAADMLAAARKGQVPPFEVSVMADPNGAYTTAAALVALAEKRLREQTGEGYAGRKAVIFGGGPVGLCTAVLIHRQGGEVALARLTSPKPEREAAARGFLERYDVDIPWLSAQDAAAKQQALMDADVVVTSAKAGIRILDQALLTQAPRARVLADVNAVPPSGIEGVEATDKDASVNTGAGSASGIGALAIGNIKYKVQSGLLKQMQSADSAQVLDFPDAFLLARECV